MASPNFDALNLQHSKNIGDPVATASTDGKRWSAAQRSYHINEGIRRWLRKHYDMGMRKELKDADSSKHWESLGSYVVLVSDSLVASMLSLDDWGSSNIDVAWIINAYNSTDSQPVKRIPTRMLPYVNGINSFLQATATNQYFYVEDRKFKLLGGTATSAIALTYVKQHADLSVGGSTDIEVPSHSWDQVLDLAYKVAMEEVGDSESAAKGVMKEQMVDGQLA